MFLDEPQVVDAFEACLDPAAQLFKLLAQVPNVVVLVGVEPSEVIVLGRIQVVVGLLGQNKRAPEATARHVVCDRN